MDNKFQLAKVSSACGRLFLEIAGYTVAVQGDRLHDSSLSRDASLDEELGEDVVAELVQSRQWDDVSLHQAADKINDRVAEYAKEAAEDYVIMRYICYPVPGACPVCKTDGKLMHGVGENANSFCTACGHFPID